MLFDEADLYNVIQKINIYTHFNIKQWTVFPFRLSQCQGNPLPGRVQQYSF